MKRKHGGGKRRKRRRMGKKVRDRVSKLKSN